MAFNGTTFGQSGDPELQPGWKIEEGDDDLLRGVATFHCNSVATIPRRGDLHPRDSRLYLIRREFGMLKTGKYEANCTYMGLAVSPTRKILEWPGASGQDPIETHPDFKSSIGGSKGSELNGAVFDDDGSFQGFADPDNDLYGKVSYPVPNPMVYLSFWTYTKPNLKTEGTIVQNIPNLVKPPNVKNWLLISTPYREIAGLIYQVREQYLGSDRRGWPTSVHG